MKYPRCQGNQTDEWKDNLVLNCSKKFPPEIHCSIYRSVPDRQLQRNMASWVGDPVNAAGDWRIPMSPLAHNTIQRPAMATDNHWRPPAAASELSSSGYITLLLPLVDLES
ncbi:hypothetical protein FB451DRAFT_1178569 [Mycena latifolia]|nr:hypothetical protein FB451DRAFT_1178569 [Mycena latifolia]